MVGAHRAAGVRRLVESGEHLRALRPAAEVVRLVGDPPGRRQTGGQRAGPEPDGDRLHGGVAGEPGAEQLAVERPAVLGVGRGVHADEPAAAAHVLLQRGPAGRVEHVTGRGQEHHRPVAGQPRRRERGRVLGRRDGEPGVGRELADRGDAGRDRCVPEAGRPGEDQHPVRHRSGRRAGRDRCRGRRRRKRPDRRPAAPRRPARAASPGHRPAPRTSAPPDRRPGSACRAGTA